MKALKIILLALALITFQAHAKDDSNLAGTSSGNTGKRIALVIGNGNYQHSDSLPKLANPTHDAEDVAAALRSFGFEVIEKKDQSLEGMSDAITEFSRKIADSDAALFYFAGHGLQVKGQNYIIPVDARIETEAQVSFKSINVNLILEEMENGKSRANIVMLDACRNNPISGKFRSGGTRGLAAPTNQPKGSVIVYATDPGNVAADGDGRNGLFTAGLLTAFKGNDLSLGGVLTRASEEVERDSKKTQIPYVNGPMALQKSFQFRRGTQVASLEPVPTPGYAPPAPSRVKTKEEIEDEYWEEIKESNDLASYKQYSRAYPNGRYINTANLKIIQLRKKVQDAILVTQPSVPAQPGRIKSREEIEQDAWESVRNSGNIEAIQEYLKQYQKGQYVGQARILITTLKTSPAKPAEPVSATPTRDDGVEVALWNAVEKGNSKEDYDAYITQYPKGKFIALANNRIKKLQDEAAETARREHEFWQKAQADEKGQIVQAYLDKYPNGSYVVVAQEKLASIRKAGADVKSSYLGCFKDQGDSLGTNGRDISGYKFDSSEQTIEECIATCKKKGFPYAGLQYASQCFCGTSYGNSGKANNCTMKCSGNSSQICGGNWANSVYRVQ